MAGIQINKPKLTPGAQELVDKIKGKVSELKESGGIYGVVSRYLQTGMDGLGMGLHIAGIMTSAYANAGPKYGSGSVVPFMTAFIGGLNTGGLTKFNLMVDTVMKGISDPNIEGVPIRTTKISVQRQVDVSEQASIVQAEKTKEYNVDNAVPRLRRWQIEGYLSLIQPAMDYFYTIKPSLLLQAAFLDACAASRVPVWFKDNNNAFHHVLITSFQAQQVADTTNAIQVTVGLIEYKPFEIKTSSLASTDGVKIGSDTKKAG